MVDGKLGARGYCNGRRTQFGSPHGCRVYRRACKQCRAISCTAFSAFSSLQHWPSIQFRVCWGMEQEHHPPPDASVHSSSSRTSAYSCCLPWPHQTHLGETLGRPTTIDAPASLRTTDEESSCQVVRRDANGARIGNSDEKCDLPWSLPSLSTRRDHGCSRGCADVSNRNHKLKSIANHGCETKRESFTKANPNEPRARSEGEPCVLVASRSAKADVHKFGGLDEPATSFISSSGTSKVTLHVLFSGYPRPYSLYIL